MGNTPPYVVQLGNFASINILEGEANGEHYEKRSVSYRADERSAEVSIKRIKPPNNKSNGSSSKFIISITDTDKMNILPVRLWPYRFEMMVERVEGQHLKVTYAKTRVVHDKDIAWGVVALAKVGVTLPRLNVYEEDATKKRKMSTSADGGITETSLNPYRVKGRDKQRGLVVIEWKKKVWNENPHMVIVSHYFASLAGTGNTGFSVVATIRGEDGELEVGGPDFHPATSLFEMFDQVLRSGRWTPNACPHCATAASTSANTGGTATAYYYPPNQSQPTKMLQSNGENNKRNQQWFNSLAS